MARRRSSNSRRRTRDDEPATLVSRSAFCSLAGISELELSQWEREELIGPRQIARIGGRPEPLYDSAALGRARMIRTLAEDLEVNLPGISVILGLLDRMGR
jgi:DNA-binding transcriptional MerR regulator